jgi:hypothetical protein
MHMVDHYRIAEALERLADAHRMYSQAVCDVLDTEAAFHDDRVPGKVDPDEWIEDLLTAYREIIAAYAELGYAEAAIRKFYVPSTTSW